jgi:peptidoglycan/LPS O-acetylase OafA/YrhL
MFFVISGYLITSNASRRWHDLGHVDLRAFYVLRIARIMPCLLLLLVIVNVLALSGLAIFQNHAPTGTLVSFWVVNLASLTFWMNALIGRYGWVNYPLGVLWSLSVEEVFYLIFPLLCVLLQRPSRLIAFWAAIIIAGPLYRAAHQGDEGGFLYAYFACFDGIAIGCCAALLVRIVPTRGLSGVVPQTLTITLMALVYLCGPIGETNVWGVTAMAIGTAVMLVGAYHRPVDDRPAAGTAVLRWFGRQSYELYLFHLVVLGVMRTIFVPQTVAGSEKLLLLAGFFLFSTACSQLIARCYAEPLNGLLRRRLSEVRQTVARG